MGAKDAEKTEPDILIFIITLVGFYYWPETQTLNHVVASVFHPSMYPNGKVVIGLLHCSPSNLTPKPEMLNSKPQTLNPQNVNPEPSSLNPKP